MLGCSAGNGHPYSWSAMFNGYDRDLMTRECPYAGIPEYLNKQPAETLTIPGFLKFEQTFRAARKGRNPQTGEEIQVPAANAAKVSAGNKLKKRAKSGQ